MKTAGQRTFSSRRDLARKIWQRAAPRAPVQRLIMIKYVANRRRGKNVHESRVCDDMTPRGSDCCVRVYCLRVNERNSGTSSTVQERLRRGADCHASEGLFCRR